MVTGQVLSTGTDITGSRPRKTFSGTSHGNDALNRLRPLVGPDVTPDRNLALQCSVEFAEALIQTKDYTRARQWYEKAAAGGSAGAMNGLGAIYENGLGMPKDYTQARRWYERAAEGGSEGAKKSLERLSRSR